MRPYIVEISAKLILNSSADPQELPADIYAQIAEFIAYEDQLSDLEVQTFALPDSCFEASSDRRNDLDTQEATES